MEDSLTKLFCPGRIVKALIETQGGRMTKVKKVDGNPIRCVFLRLNDNIDKDGFEPVETMDKYEQEELPFK